MSLPAFGHFEWLLSRCLLKSAIKRAAAPCDTEFAMDPTAFEIWLGEIAALTETQRRLACQALVLSEGAGSRDIETARSWLAILTGRRTNRWRAVRRRSRGQRPRLARPVSPNLGNAAWTALGVLIAATVTSCIGVGRAICRATAAKPVGARSTP